MIPLINCFQRLWFTTFLVHLFNFLCRSFSYEKKYREAVESKSAEQIKDERVQEAPTKVETTSKVEVKEANPQSTTSTSSSTEQDLDVFLLGEAGDSDDDDGPGAYILVNFVAAAVLKNGCYWKMVATSLVPSYFTPIEVNCLLWSDFSLLTYVMMTTFFYW